MNKPLSLTEIDVRKLAENWFSKLDIHAPVEDYFPLFAFEEEGFIMQFPNTSVQSLDQFRQWYDAALHLFFDEVHAVKELSIKDYLNYAEVTAIIHWEASMWKPPAANSERIVLDAHHTWVITQEPNTHKPRFKNYIVHSFDFAEGSAKPGIPGVDSTKNR